MMTNALDILVQDTESDPKLGPKYEFRIAFIVELLVSYAILFVSVAALSLGAGTYRYGVEGRAAAEPTWSTCTQPSLVYHDSPSSLRLSPSTCEGALSYALTFPAT